MREIFDLNGKLVKDREGILNAQKEFYQKLYRKEETINLENSSLHWVTQYIKRIPGGIKEELEKEVELEEIKITVFATKNNKSTGLDGFSNEFLKLFWVDLKYVMLSTFKEYLKNNRLTKTTTNWYYNMSP